LNVAKPECESYSTYPPSIQGELFYTDSKKFSAQSFFLRPLGASRTEVNMAHLQSDGAQVFALWRNEGMTSYRKRTRDSAQPAKLMIDIASGEARDHESPKKTMTKRKPPSRKIKPH
jgi:hypothetical protein